METRKLEKMKADIKIENLKCAGCATTIKKGLSSLETITNVEVDVENSIVSVTSESENIEIVREKLSKLGYPEAGDKNTLVHKAKSFVSCAVGRIDS